MLEEISHPFRFLSSQWRWSDGGQRLGTLFDSLPWGGTLGAHGRARALQRISQSLCEVHGVSLHVTGSLPKETAIYVSNHLGYIDPVAICSLVPCAPIAKAEVREWPIVGHLGRSMNVIFVRRADTASAARALRRAMRSLEAGVSVLNFPEGTTTRGEMLNFHRGIFGLAALMNIPIIPLAIRFEAPSLCWVDDDTLLGHYTSELVGKAHEVHIEVGPRQYMEGCESPAEFAARVRSWTVAALAQRTRVQSAAARSLDSARCADSPITSSI